MRMRTVLSFTLAALVIALGISACQQASKSASPSAPAVAPQLASDVVGRVGDRTITLAEVDAKWKAMNPSEQWQALDTMYKGRRAALDAIIGDDVIGRAAKK